MHKASDQTAKGPASLAATLLDTLEEEHVALTRLHDQLDRQLAAISDHDHEGVEETVVRTSDEVNVLARLKHTRDRQIRLLGRVLRLEGDVISLGDVVDALQDAQETKEVGARLAGTREQVRRQARETRDRCRDLEFSLQYSVHLGRELLQALQGTDVPTGGRHYTSHGSAVESSNGQRSIVNRVG